MAARIFAWLQYLLPQHTISRLVGWLGVGQAGFFALALVGAPYTQSQLGHLNQLPPPFVLLAIAASVLALRAHDAGHSGRRWWCGGVAQPAGDDRDGRGPARLVAMGDLAPGASTTTEARAGGDIVLAENVRFNAGEKACDPGLAKRMAALADVFVTIAVIAGWQLSARGYAWADTALTTLVAAAVLAFLFGEYLEAFDAVFGCHNAVLDPHPPTTGEVDAGLEPVAEALERADVRPTGSEHRV